MDYPTLQNALAISNGALSLSSGEFGSAWAALSAQYLAGQPLVIAGAVAGTSNAQQQSVSVSGLTSFLNVANLPITATFWLDSSGGVHAVLMFQLRGATVSSNQWVLSTSFTDLPIAWNYATSSGATVTASTALSQQQPFLNSLYLYNTYFALTTDAMPDPVLNAPLQQGLNLVSQLQSQGALGFLDSIAGSTTPLLLYGPVIYPVTGAQTPPMQYQLQQRVWSQPTAPGVHLQAALPISLTLGGATLQNAVFQIYTPLSNAWMQQNPTYAPQHGYAAQLSLPTAGVTINVTVDLGWNDPTAALYAACSGVTFSKLAQLVDLAGTSTLTSTLPQALQATADQIGGLQLQAVSCALVLSGSTPAINSLYVTVGLPGLTWQPWDATLQVSDLSCCFAIDVPGSSSANISALLMGTLTVAGVPLQMQASTGTGFTLYAQLADTESLPLTALMQQYLPSVPAPSNLTISALWVSITPGASYTMTALMADQPNPWTIPVGCATLTFESVMLTLSCQQGGGVTGSFDATAAFGQDTLALQYDTTGSLAVRGYLADIQLSGLLSSLCNQAYTAPPGFDLAIAPLCVMITSQGGSYTFQAAATLAHVGTLAFTAQSVSGGQTGFAVGVQLTQAALGSLAGLSALSALESFVTLQNELLILSSFNNAGFAFLGMAQFQEPMLPTANITLPGTGGVIAGLNVYAQWALNTGNQQQAMLQKLLGLGPTLEVVIQIGADPANDSRLSVGLQSTIEGQPFNCLVGVQLTGGSASFFLTGTLTVGIQGSPCAFSVTTLFLPTGAFLSGTMQGSVTFSGITLSDVAVQIGVDDTGVPSLGVAATVTVGKFNGAVAVFLDSVTPANSMLAGSISNLSLADVASTLAGIASFSVPAAITSALSQVQVSGTGSFTLPLSAAADLNGNNAASVSADFAAAGITLPSSPKQLLIVSSSTPGTWFVTDLSQMRHYQLVQGASSIAGSVNCQLYVAPQATNIGTLSYPQGFYLSGTLSFFGFSLSAQIQVSSGQGVSVSASMSPLTLVNANFFSLTGAGGAGGPTFSMSTYAQPSQTDPNLQQPHLLISGALSLLGCSESVYVSIGTSGLAFNVTFSTPAVSWAVAGSLATSGSMSASGNLTVGLQGVPPLSFGPLGSVSLNTNLGGSLSMSYSGSTASASLSGSATVLGQSFSTGTVTLHVGTDTLTGLPQEVANALKGPIQTYLNVASQWLSCVKSGFLQGVSGAAQIGQVLAGTFKQTGAAAAAAMHAAGYAATDVANALKAGYAETDAAVASALKTLGYADAAVGGALKAVFSDSDAAAAAAMNAAGYAASDVATALKATYNDTDQAVAQIFKNLGVSAANVAIALKAVWSDTDTAVANVFYNIAFSQTDIANGLKAAFNDTDSAVATILNNQHYTATQIATALHSVYNDTDQAVAQIFKSLGVSAANVAIALKAVWSDTDTAVANVFYNIAFSQTDIANGLKAAFNDTDSAVATILNNQKYTSTQIAGALKSAYSDTDSACASALKAAGISDANVGTALKSAYGDSDSACASAMKAAGFAASDITSALSSAYGDSGAAIANVLSGLGYSASVIDSALKSVFGSTHVDTSLGHVDSKAHGDVGHVDGAHVDGAHVDSHDDTHDDTRALGIHVDGAHVDGHDDTHDDTHLDTPHGDSSTHTDTGTHIDA